MSKTELSAYYRHLDNLVILKDNIFTEREEGREEGKVEGILKVASSLKEIGMSVVQIALATGLTVEEIGHL